MLSMLQGILVAADDKVLVDIIFHDNDKVEGVRLAKADEIGVAIYGNGGSVRMRFIPWTAITVLDVLA